MIDKSFLNSCISFLCGISDAPTHIAATATAKIPVSFKISSATVYVISTKETVVMFSSSLVMAWILGSANTHNSPPASPTAPPIAILMRNMAIPYPGCRYGVTIHSKIRAARIILTASLNMPSTSRMLRTLLFTRIAFINGTMTVGPVAAASAPKRSAKCQSSPASS